MRVQCLEASKTKGKYHDSLHASADAFKTVGIELTSRLQLSVVNGMEGFRLVYQPPCPPVICLAGAEVAAVVRRALGEVMPDEFILAFNPAGSLCLWGKWVLEQAVKPGKKWSAREPDFHHERHISHLQMLDELPGTERTPEAENGLTPGMLCRSYGELLCNNGYGRPQGNLSGHLRGMCIQIAMDDLAQAITAGDAVPVTGGYWRLTGCRLSRPSTG